MYLASNLRVWYPGVFPLSQPVYVFVNNKHVKKGMLDGKMLAENSLGWGSPCVVVDEEDPSIRVNPLLPALRKRTKVILVSPEMCSS